MNKEQHFILGAVFAFLILILSMWVLTWLGASLEVEKDLNARRLPNFDGLSFENVKVDYWDCNRPEYAMSEGCENQFKITGLVGSRPVTCYGNSKYSVGCFYDK